MAGLKIGDVTDCEKTWSEVLTIQLRHLRLLKYRFPVIPNEDWEDLISDTVEDFMTSLRSGKLIHCQDTEVGAYTYRILWNKSADLSKRILQTQKEDDKVVEPIYLEEEPYIEKQTVVLNKNLQRLGTFCQAIIELFYSKHSSHAEICKQLDLDNENVSMQRLSRCKTKLRDLCFSDMKQMELIG